MNGHEHPQDCLDAETITYGGEDFEFLGHWSTEYVELYGECEECGREIKRIYTYSGVEEDSGFNVPTSRDGDCVR